MTFFLKSENNLINKIMNVICIILLVMFLLFGLGCLFSEEYIAATASFIFAILIGIIIFFIIKEEKENINTSTIIENVIDYQIDTNIIINETDTLKTYTITYFTE